MNTDLNLHYDNPETAIAQTLEDARILEATPQKLRHIAQTIEGQQPITAQALRQLANQKESSQVVSHGYIIFARVNQSLGVYHE